MNISEIYEKLKKADYNVSTDTRNLTERSLFFAWRGKFHNGNEFAQEALKKGCSYVIIDDANYQIDEHYILVPDSIKMLQDLAHYHRMQFNIPVIGLTGSNGKTTTKELIASVLGYEKRIIATEGNLNNHVGVPKTLLRIRPETDIVIIEMGANHVGEIAELCRIAHPTHGLITNIGRAHIGLFGSFENIIRGKTELYRYLEHSGGVSFINGSDALLLEQSNTSEKITYLSDDSDVPFFSEKSLPFVSGKYHTNFIKTQLTGEYNISNISAAIAVGNYFGISETSIMDGISTYKPTNQRSEIIEKEQGNIIIKDYYNANHSSMELAIQNLKNIKTDKEKVAILGDMFELGDYEHEDHLAIAKIVDDFDRVVLIGKAFSQLDINNKNIEQFKTIDEAIFALQKSPIQNSYILLKASQGMNFQKLFDEVDF